MNRMELNYSIYVILTVLFLMVAATGFVMYLAIPQECQRADIRNILE